MGMAPPGSPATMTPSLDPADPPLPRQRCAVLVLDVVESVRLMQLHEDAFIRRWRRFVQSVQTRVLPAQDGRLVKSLGDGLLATFPSARQGVDAALAAQSLMRGLDRDGETTLPPLRLRAGLHLGDVVADGLDVYGSDVNLAARLASAARPGEVVVSAAVRDGLLPGVDAELEDLGELTLRHVAEPVRAFRAGPPQPVPGAAALDSSLGDLDGPAIAVLPFPTLTEDPGAACAGDLLADELIAGLSRTRELRVISGLSTRALSGREVPLGELRERLGAHYVVSGRVIVSGGARLRVTVTLTDATSSLVLHAATLQGTLGDLLDADGEVVGGLLAEIGRAICQREVQRARGHLPASLASHSLMLAAITLMHRAAREDSARAQVLLEHLCERDPRHAAARAWLAKWHVLQVVQGWAPADGSSERRALDEVHRALDINPGSSLALTLRGLVRAYLGKDFDAAGRDYAEALDLNPNEPLAWLFHATLTGWQGRGGVAVPASERALSLSPLDPMKYFFDSLAATAALSGQDAERPIRLARRSLRQNRLHASTWRTLVFALDRAGRADEAREAGEDLMRVEPGLTLTRFAERFPGRDGPLMGPWLAALERAGVPRH